LAKVGIQVPPIAIYDAAIRTGPFGDWFGVRRSGWSLAKLRAQKPHGVVLVDHLPVQELRKVLETPDGNVRLVPTELLAEYKRLLAHADPDGFELRAIGMRELHSHNSWMHNVPRMMPADRVPSVLVHPDDAATAGLDRDGPLEVESARGSIVMHALITDEMSPGTVAVPHGWGHNGGWSRANAAGGANANELTSAMSEDIEPLSGMSILSGIPIRIRSITSDPHR
jgi:formate dehydrogenase